MIDSSSTQIQDLGSNFFLFDEDVASGVSRATACAPRLQELNPICSVKVAESLSDNIILAHSAVVITTMMPLEELCHLDEFCSQNKISFFYNYISGVSSSLFVNHGPNHVVNDPDGERPMQKLIVDVQPIDEKCCLLRYETPEGQIPVAIDEGDYEINEVEGVDGINGKLYSVQREWKDPVKTIRVPLSIGSLPPYVTGGILTQKKMPKKHPMEPLRAKLKSPGFPGDGMVSTDLLGFTEMQQHIAFHQKEIKQF